MNKEKLRAALQTPGIYPVISPGFTKGRPLQFVLEQLASAGADIVQLRMKNEPAREIMQEADNFREICSAHGIALIIDDRPDIALACGADGVHLGQDDIPHWRIANFAKQLFVGVSTHSLDEALDAEKKGAGYINIGPIFHTGTKRTGIPPLGLDVLRNVVRSVRIPVTVMGGIKAANIPELLAAGAKRIAMVTEICEANDIVEKFKELARLFKTD